MSLHIGLVHHYPFRALAGAFVVLFAICWLLGDGAQAAVQMVTNENDAGPGSLREALDKAKSGDEIVFKPSLGRRITLTSARLFISTSLTMTGPGLTDLIIDGGNKFVVFDVFPRDGGTVTISGLTITHGKGGGLRYKGANGSNLTLRNVDVTNNTAEGCAGIDAAFADTGTMTLDTVTVSGNTAKGGPPFGDGGGICFSGASLVVSKSTIKSNTATESGGGIYIDIFSDGTDVVLMNSSVLSNSAEKRGGGIFLAGGKLSLSGVTIGENLANQDGGGIFSRADGELVVTAGTSIRENVALGIGGGIFRGDRDTSKGSITIDGSTISSNKATGGTGGGLFIAQGPVHVSNSTIMNNMATADGGGIRHLDDTFGRGLTIDRSTISGNKAIRQIGLATGGGISNAGRVIITNSTISNNSTTGHGGGLFNDSSMLVINSTVSGNTASDGGGIANAMNPASVIGGSILLDFTTITDNTNGGIVNKGGRIRLNNTIIATQRAGKDCVGPFESLLFNLDSDNSCGLDQPPTDLPNVAAPKLGPLQNNGGPTFTHALLKGSPAIDSVFFIPCGQQTDQRGVTRPQGAQKRCDRGAFEFKETITLKVGDGFQVPMIDGAFTPSTGARIEPTFIDEDGNVLQTGTFSL